MWPILKNPPVVLAIFQIRFTELSDIAFSDIGLNDAPIRELFPLRQDNFLSDIGVQGTPAPGISMLKAKIDTKINSYTYSTKDQFRKAIIEKNGLTVVIENGYAGWDSFKSDVMGYIRLFDYKINKQQVERVSIRFVNRFVLNNFEEPLDFFTKTISTETEIKYPVLKSSFKLELTIPDSAIKALVNHAIEQSIDDKNNVDYFLDIDVLDYHTFNYDLSKVDVALEKIRIVKNEIFFDTVKNKIIALCS